GCSPAQGRQLLALGAHGEVERGPAHRGGPRREGAALPGPQALSQPIIRDGPLFRESVVECTTGRCGCGCWARRLRPSTRREPTNRCFGLRMSLSPHSLPG